MSAIKSQHSHLFGQLVAKRRADLLDGLAQGFAADYAAYRQLVGQLQGLDDALNLSEEADFKLNGEDVAGS